MSSIIIINGTSFSAVNNVNKEQDSIIPESGFINQSLVDLQYELWSKNYSELEYSINCTNAERWILDQLLLAHTKITFVDTKIGLNTYVWIESISENWNFDNWSKPWLVTISLIVIPTGD